MITVRLTLIIFLGTDNTTLTTVPSALMKLKPSTKTHIMKKHSMDQKCASDICTLFEKLIRFQCYHLLRYGIKLKMTGSPGKTLPLICMLKDMLDDILSNTGLYLVVLGQ